MKIMRSNPTANGMKAVDVAERFRYRRATRRRARLEDGVIRVRFIKTLRPDAPLGVLPEPPSDGSNPHKDHAAMLRALTRAPRPGGAA